MTDVSQQKSTIFQKLEFWSLSPRLNRAKYLGLLSFWFGVLFLLTSLLEKHYNIMALLAFLIFPNFIALALRRMHDLNLSGRWFIIMFIPFIGLLFSLLLFFKSGVKGTNKYGSAQETTDRIYYYMMAITPIIVLFLATTRAVQLHS